MENKSIFELLFAFTHQLEEFTDEMDWVKADDVGLDRRCGKLSINEECIIVPKDNQRMIEYYGGFEYIPSECKQVVGDYVIYTEHERVQDCIDRWMENKEGEE